MLCISSSKHEILSCKTDHRWSDGRLPFSEVLGGLDGDIHGLDNGERTTATIYYFCASNFGWTKETTDSQSVKFLKNLLIIHKEISDQLKNTKLKPPPPPKNFK